METLAQRVARLRLVLGISPAELARRAHVSKSQISRLESGMSRPPAATLAKVGAVLGVTADYLLSGAEPLPREAYPPHLVQLFDDLQRLPEPDRTQTRLEVERVVRDAQEREAMRRRIRELENNNQSAG